MMADHPEMSAGELADFVSTTLPDDDRELVQQFLNSEARTILAFEVRARHAQNRTGIFNTIDIHRTDAPSVAQLSERRRDTLYDRVEAWREYDPTERRSRALLDMNRPALLESANFDLQKMAHFGFKGLLKQRLAEGLPNDTVTVAEVYTTEQVVDLTERVKKEFNRGNLRLKLKPIRPLSG
jgi:hypothetical protein